MPRYFRTVPILIRPLKKSHFSLLVDRGYFFHRALQSPCFEVYNKNSATKAHIKSLSAGVVREMIRRKEALYMSVHYLY